MNDQSIAEMTFFDLEYPLREVAILSALLSQQDDLPDGAFVLSNFLLEKTAALMEAWKTSFENYHKEPIQAA